MPDDGREQNPEAAQRRHASSLDQLRRMFRTYNTTPTSSSNHSDRERDDVDIEAELTKLKAEIEANTLN